jgi:hypothetical protein
MAYAGDTAVPAPHLVGPIPRTTPPSLRSRPVPFDLLREASRRLRVVALLCAGLWTFGFVLHHVGLHVLGLDWLRIHVPDAIIGGEIAVSLALYVYAGRGERDPRAILDLGLVYMVVLAVGAGQMFHWQAMPAHTPVAPMISWIGVIVLMFAAIIPTTPGKTLVAGLFAVSMSPVGMFIARARGTWDFGPWTNAFVMHVPDYLIVGIAVVVSGVVRRLGMKVTQAREMGSYRLGELLGRGGMGEVYKATHQMLARPAAIKLIRPEMLGGQTPEAAETALKRFRREAETAAQLRSPHTVELYDFGVTEDGTLYFVMELLEGMDLEELVRKHGPLPAPRAVHVLAQVCDSLEEAHARGLIHRDIKPANLHVGALGLRHDFVKVLDFGLVKSVTATEVKQSLETAAGLTPGTPAYMAPEMVTGAPLDGRADLYALGCVAFFLLTGHLVFEGTSPLQVLAQHLQEPPPRPSERTELPVPAALDELVLRLLAKKPAERPASAAEVARALGEIEGEWTQEDARRWWSQHRPVLG